MEKVKKWLEPSKNKAIASVLAVALIAAVGTGIYFITKKDVPDIVFKENIMLEYGQKSFSDDQTVEDSEEKEALEVLNPEDLIIKEKSKYDEISFNKISNGNTPMTLEFRFVDTSEVGKHEGMLFARLGNELKEFTFEYDVIDTNNPIIENVVDQELIEGEEFKHDFKAYDIVDGELEVLVEGEYDVTTPGSYDLKAVATDKNNNKTEVGFKLSVTEKEVAIGEESNTALPSTGSNGGDSTNNGRKPNTGSNNNNGGSNNGGSNNGGTTTKPVSPTKPVEPTNPVKPVEPTKPDREWKIYGNYGTTAGCSAVGFDIMIEHINEWSHYMCDSNGDLIYRLK
ncbi:hypothetical protein PT160_07810 [Erysipelothrix rhusiopathiae]|nr:hypothetical protein [Erysipelothrix rhusiopathiae]MDE8269070.1 hypothetical protein [Erysipelothrix rhusiopathiae]MDE8270661.1 hypothetical protein [Erysipelothrix rhusiopathiae]MDE8279086.1 hypothetical protein [Erysipelothrix rhusiopathiae]MDE8319428.1 hypothetical protein [Erysipelothrix rhusiopathiae]